MRLCLKRALDLKRKLDVGRCCHWSGVERDLERRKTQKFKRNATGGDTSRILETEMGYECHPETDQSTIPRKRLEERLLKRKINIPVRDHLHRENPNVKRK